MPRRKIPEVKARLMIAISDRLEHAGAALVKFREPAPNADPKWIEGMELHYAVTCEALLCFYECIDNMEWRKADDNEQKLQECIEAFRGSAEQKCGLARENHRNAASEETEAELYAAEKALAAIKWVWDLIYPGDARQNSMECSNGETQTVEERQDTV